MDELVSNEGIDVLHVDDDPDLVDMVADFLEIEDPELTVYTATSPSEGWELLTERDLDCVISDYDMPAKNGVEFLDDVREHDEDLPFILYTGEGSEEVASEAISAGVTDYVQKSQNTDHYALLAKKVRNAVEKHRAVTSQTRQFEAIENAKEGIAILDGGGEIVYVNDAYANIYGFDRAELLGQQWEALYPEGRREYARKEILDKVHEDGVWHGETTGLRSDGTTFSEDHSISMTEGGEMICTVRDLSDENERKEELRLKRGAVESAPVGVVLTDPNQEDNPIIYANEKFEEVTGYEPSEVIGRNCRMLQGDDTDDKRLDGMRQAIENEEQTQVVVKNYKKNGEPFWNRLTVAPVRNDDGDVINYAGFQQDVTEEERRKAELREERAFFEAALDALDDLFYVIDSEGNLLRWNKKVEEVTGYTESEVEEMVVSDFFDGEDAETIVGAINELYETGEAQVEAGVRTKSGRVIPHQFNSSLIESEDDSDSLGFVGIGRDITTLRKREKRLEREKERLEQFTSVLSHDLRNPLNVATGRLEMAVKELDDPPEHLETVKGAHERMEALIEDILKLAREGQEVTEMREVPLDQLADTTWDVVETTEANLNVETDSAVTGDESRLKHVFENLFRNAVEHNDGEVHITVEETPRGFAVEDDGVGIPEDKRDRVFEYGHTTSEDGTGFGLAIVKQMAEAHGWRVQVVEGEDGGARFEFCDVEFTE